MKGELDNENMRFPGHVWQIELFERGVSIWRRNRVGEDFNIFECYADLLFVFYNEYKIHERLFEAENNVLFEDVLAFDAEVYVWKLGREEDRVRLTFDLIFDDEGVYKHILHLMLGISEETLRKVQAMPPRFGRCNDDEQDGW